MKRKYTITVEDAEKIKEYRKHIKEKMANRRMYAVQLVGEGKRYQDIADKLDCKVQQVGQWVKKYALKGMEGLDPKVGGRRHENMKFEEEAEFLEQYRKRAEAGQIIEVSEIKAAYEAIVGHSRSHGQIYSVLKRHGWRKIKPRSRHPKKASEEAINASKKLSKL